RRSSAAMERIASNLEVKSGFLLKKSQNRHFFTRDNYKRRFFVLSPMSLQYFEPSDENPRHKMKGRIFLALMKAVETVQRGALDCQQQLEMPQSGDSCSLQIVYVEDVHNTFYTMYATAPSQSERDSWLSAIRQHAVARGARFAPTYHPSVWRAGRFACCAAGDKRAQGCQPAMPTDGAAATGALEENGSGRQPLAPHSRSLSNLQQPQQQQQQQAEAVAASTEASGAVFGDAAGVTAAAPPVGGNVVVAIHNFRPMRENQLKLEKGNRYIVVDGTNSKWWYVRDSAGEYGYIPTNYIRKPDSLETFDWYYRKISRQRAEHMLLDAGRKEGCFLVRDSVSKKDAYTLSVMAKDVNNRSEWRVHHYHINLTEDNQFYLSEKHAFPSIPELIYYHKHNSGGLVVRLRSPPSLGQEAPAPAGLGFDELEVDPAELRLDPEPVGRGQFGEVRRGQLRGTQVAVKLMLDGNMAEDDFIEEARNMRNLNHPNLVQLFGVVTKSKPVMIITDFMPYGSLKDFLRSRRTHYLKNNRVAALLDVCNQVAVAMMYLEERNVIHRDLASRNILVKSVLHLHGYIEVKVSDFGMARFLLDQEYDASAGSKFPVRWAAPEVFQCNKYSARSDVWAFGILMWEVFTACDTPYQGKTNPEVCEYVMEGGVLEKPRLCPEQQVYIYVMLECWKASPVERPTFSAIVAKFDTLLESSNALR
ncbi:hypothetical protein BOX15_Mlig029197g1, partial [Macrostomum lignano]